jgi:hypothetical protein
MLVTADTGRAAIRDLQPTIDDRILAIRKRLPDRTPPEARGVETAQYPWYNWPNWNNWSNWGNWFNY